VSQLKIFGAIQGNDLALVDNCHPLTNLVCLFHVVSRKKDGHTLPSQVDNNLTNLSGYTRIQPSGGLIEKQNRRLVEQGAGNQ
jgi:hypothetical protein